MATRKETRHSDIEPVGAGGEIGAGQSGKPLHKPAYVADRERVGAGGPLGDPGAEIAKEKKKSAASDAVHEIVEDERRHGEIAIGAEPDQKDELDRHGKP